MLIMQTEMHPCCILRSPFDTVSNALFEYSYNPGRPLQTNSFHKCSHISSPKRSPDMILKTFDMKFHE